MSLSKGSAMTVAISRRSLLCTSIAALAVASLPVQAADGSGILLLAHGNHGAGGHGHGAHDKHAGFGGRGYTRGGHAAHLPIAATTGNPWHDNVDAIVATLNKTRPTEVAYGMADPASMQDAVDRLEKRGVTRIAAIPLFVSSHSPIIGNFRYILGLQNTLGARTQLKQLDRVTSKAAFTFSNAMDADPLVSEILHDRAKSAAQDPSKTNVVIIAHGPNAEEDNVLWLKDMEKHAAFLRQKGFRTVEVLTHRNDAPPEIKNAARTAFRARVENASRDGQTVVVPLLLSRGGIEKEVESDLAGLKFTFTAPLAPHPNLARWVESRYQALMVSPET